MSEQDIQHINRLGTVSLTRSDQLQLVFVIGVVIPHSPNSDHHGRPTVLRFVVVCFFYVARYVAQRSKFWIFPTAQLGRGLCGLARLPEALGATLGRPWCTAGPTVKIYSLRGRKFVFILGTTSWAETAHGTFIMYNATYIFMIN